MPHPKSISFVTALLFTLTSLAQDFSTDLNGVRKAVATKVAGEPALFVSSLGGDVACYSLKGRQLWKQTAQTPAVMFELKAADIDGDGKDELLGASGDGSIHCWNNDGRPRWDFTPDSKVRFSAIAVLEAGAQSRIFAAGNDYQIYELNAEGKSVSTTPFKGMVRKIEVGDFLKTGEPSIFLMTLAHDKFNWEFFGFLDPKTKSVQKSFEVKDAPKTWSRFMVTDISVADLDHDGRDELLIFGDGGDAASGSARFMAYNGDFKEVASFSAPTKDKQRYAHVIGTSLQPLKDEIVMQLGGILYHLDAKGKLLHQSGERYGGIVFNDLVVVPETGLLVAAGEVDGGNGIYLYSLEQKEWWNTEHQLQGRMHAVRDNLQKLYEQTLRFTPPAYQKAPTLPWVMITPTAPRPEVEKLKASDIKFVKQFTWTENTDRSAMVAAFGKDALKKDRRGKYDETRETIVAKARAMEADGTPFSAWAGHGTDPFYLQIDTMEAILEAAPTTCYGFVYAEMANTEDPRVHYFINEYIPRLAAACRKQGRAKLYFRYKNIFWAATSHLEPWKQLFYSRKYSDVLVPSAEDTNSRTQDLNFIGRVGMLAAGYVNDFATRLVDDNPTSWRPFSPGGQRSVSPYLRSGVLLAAYGARYGVLFDISYLEDPGMNILFALMKSGALPVVERDDIQSIGSWLLVQDIDQELVDSIEDGHGFGAYNVDEANAILSVAPISWAGTSLPDHDFSKRALGVQYRWLNFIPPMPYGMVPDAPIEYQKTLQERGIPYMVTDLKSGIVDGKKVPANAFGQTMTATLEAGAKRLPVLVAGAAWSLIRLDANHSRLVLVDPGYIDPQDRDVTVKFQGKVPSEVRDILSGEAISVGSSEARLTVPAGSLRLIDLTY